MNRLQAAEQLRRALQMYCATLPEEKMLEIPAVYPVWRANYYYKAGEIISHGENSVGDAQLYKVAQGHMSQDIYPPGKGTESLYTAFGTDENGFPMLAQPSGAHDAYSAGEIVNYNGTLYKSLIDGNTWAPDVYPAGWEIYDNTAEPGENEYPAWVQPSGQHDAYPLGAKVSHNNKKWVSTVANNVWEPGAFGWEEEKEN